MFDEIFKRWIETNQLAGEDLIPIFLEWDQTFGEGKITGDQVIAMLNQDPRIQIVDMGATLNKAMTYLGIKKGYQWYSVLTADGQLLKRHFM